MGAGCDLACMCDLRIAGESAWFAESFVKLGIIPYYMFVERDTGAKNYFEVPLAEAYHIYREAMKQVSGLARTARGPSMSAGPGKVEIQGVEQSRIRVLDHDAAVGELLADDHRVPGAGAVGVLDQLLEAGCKQATDGHAVMSLS